MKINTSQLIRELGDDLTKLSKLRGKPAKDGGTEGYQLVNSESPMENWLDDVYSPENMSVLAARGENENLGLCLTDKEGKLLTNPTTQKVREVLELMKDGYLRTVHEVLPEKKALIHGFMADPLIGAGILKAHGDLGAGKRIQSNGSKLKRLFEGLGKITEKERNLDPDFANALWEAGKNHRHTHDGTMFKNLHFLTQMRSDPRPDIKLSPKEIFRIGYTELINRTRGN